MRTIEVTDSPGYIYVYEYRGILSSDFPLDVTLTS